MDAASASAAAAVERLELHDRARIAGLDRFGLSAHFDPFLPVFAEQTLIAGGEVLVPRSGGAGQGLLLFDPADRFGSVFAPDTDSASALLAARTPGEFYVESDWPGPHVPFDLFLRALEPGAPGPRYRHPVRCARDGDWTAIAALTASLGGRSGPRWVEAYRRTGETCLVVEVDGRVIASGWAGRTGSRGRLHSLVVHPRYRGMHIGTDLLTARLAWLRDHGAENAISEIARENAPSVRIAMSAGMTVAGTMSLVHRPG